MHATAAAPAHDTVVSLLIDLGTIEAGVADALSPDVDAMLPMPATFRRASVAMGHALVSSWKRHAVDAGEQVREAVRELDRAAAMPLPEVIPCSVPEGFAYYALHPECYIAAAERFASDQARGRAVCLGLRTIGAPLSGVVAAVLQRHGWAVESYTVRPRGHVFDRKLLLDPSLATRIGAAAWCLIVDEGPGLSGSSFAGAAATAISLGVPRERVALFPSWRTDGARLRSAPARRLWPTLARYTVEPPELGMTARLAETAGAHAVEELSAGRWRTRCLPASRWPAVQPQHERAKYLVQATPPRVFRFAGLGRYGDARRARAEWLASHGMTPPPLELVDGYLATEWLVPGRPPEAAAAPPIAWIARYLALLESQPDVPAGTSPDELLAVARYNIQEGLGEQWADRATAGLKQAGHLLDGRAVRHDGRMLPHEWVVSAGSVCKTDALDHHDDHFYPGPANVAWDLAGAEIELGLDRSRRHALLARYAELSGDEQAARRLPFYRVLYLATRLGYSTLAAGSTAGSDDGRRFKQLSQRYRRALRVAIPALEVAGARERLPRIPPRSYDLIIFDADDTLRRTTVAGRPCPYRAGEWALLPRVRSRIQRLLRDSPPTHLGIASNQDRVGFGELEEATARDLLHDLARAAFGRELPHDAVQLCPHTPADHCRCRKPAPGMLERIMRYYGVPPRRTLFVGDTETDREAAEAAGAAFRDAELFFSSSAGSWPHRNRRTPQPSEAGSCGADARHAIPA
jgi:histidinol-phosphate phosphatase family protein